VFWRFYTCGTKSF